MSQKHHILERAACEGESAVLPLELVDKSINPFRTHFGLVDLSTMFIVSTIPLEKLFPGRNDILVYKHPTTVQDDLLPHSQRHPGSDPHWKIPVAQWPTVLHRIEQGEPLRKVAGDYHVSYEAIRRVARAARQQQQAG